MKEINLWWISWDKEEEKGNTIFQKGLEKVSSYIPCVFMIYINFVQVEIERIYILWMFIKKIYIKRPGKKFVFKRHRTYDIYDFSNKNPLANGHQHQFFSVFEASNSNFKEQFSEVSFINLKINKIEKKIYEKKEIKIDFYLNLDKEMKNILNYEGYKDISLYLDNTKYFKDLSICFNMIKELKINSNFCIKGIDLKKNFDKTIGIIFGNYTTSKRNAIPIVMLKILEGYLSKGIFMFKDKFLVIKAENMYQLIGIIMFLKQMKVDNIQTKIIKENTKIIGYKKYMSDYNKNVLKQVGLKNVKIIEFKTLKMVENHFYKILEEKKW